MGAIKLRNDICGNFHFLLLAKREGKNVTNAPSAPRAANHQMCQIIAKPMTTAKKALTNPVGVFFGISIGS